MIEYSTGRWGIRFIFQRHGSVFPKAIAWAAPNAAFGMVLHFVLRERGINLDGVATIWSGWTLVLGFLIVFRNNQAYTRFWEGGTLVNQMRGEWLNATSSLMAFCTNDPLKRSDVMHFQQLLVRLMSMLHCSALQQVADLEDDSLEILSTRGMDAESLQFLEEVPDRCEILVQWVQRHIVEANSNNLFMVAPPILSRPFQEIGRGIVNLSNARKIRDIPFPFPYAQMITFMLLVHWIVTPLMACFHIDRLHWVGITCFFVTAAMWSLLYIALEIDQPFGNDPNDLPVDQMQKDFNKGLLALLKPRAQSPPRFTYRLREHDFARSVSFDESNNTFSSMRKVMSRHSSCDSSPTRRIKNSIVKKLSILSRSRSFSDFQDHGRKSRSWDQPHDRGNAIFQEHLDESCPPVLQTIPDVDINDCVICLENAEVAEVGESFRDEKEQLTNEQALIGMTVITESDDVANLAPRSALPITVTARRNLGPSVRPITIASKRGDRASSCSPTLSWGQCCSA